MSQLTNIVNWYSDIWLVFTFGRAVLYCIPYETICNSFFSPWSLTRRARVTVTTATTSRACGAGSWPSAGSTSSSSWSDSWARSPTGRGSRTRRKYVFIRSGAQGHKKKPECSMMNILTGLDVSIEYSDRFESLTIQNLTFSTYSIIKQHWSYFWVSFSCQHW